MSLDSDPEISAAFGGETPTSSAPISDDPEIHEAFSPDAKADIKKPYSVEDAAKGAISTAGNLVLNVPYAAVHGVGDIVRRISGNQDAPETKIESALHVNPDEDAKRFGLQVGKLLPQSSGGDQPDDTNIPQFSEGTQNVIGHVLGVAGDVGGIAAGTQAVRGIAGLASAPKLATAESAQASMNAAAGGKSMGAASTAANIQQASPGLQKAIIDTTRKTGGAVNPEVLNRRLEADSLPVKMNLTEGQATQDPSIISNEQNMRGKHPELAQAFNQQNGALVDNLHAIRESAGPDVFSTNPVEHGDMLIQAYKEKGAAADAQVSANYKALKDAAGGNFPVDANALLNNATKALHGELLYDHAPKAVMSTLGRLADQGNMSFENFESLRTNLARIQRSSLDGNERAAAGVIRNQMEALPLAPGAANLKPLADTARASAKAQFQALDADPAYKAAVNDEVSPDKFVSKFITGSSATRDSVAKMKVNLADNERASQTMGVAALDHLRDQAKIDSMGNGNFASATFNKHLEAMRPKLQSLVPPEQAQQLDTLGNVARYTTAQPKGSFVNNSNTLTGALASHGANVLENVVPYGNVIRKGVGMLSDRAAVKRALDPASGLERLKESP